MSQVSITVFSIVKIVRNCKKLSQMSSKIVIKNCHQKFSSKIVILPKANGHGWMGQRRLGRLFWKLFDFCKNAFIFSIIQKCQVWVFRQKRQYSCSPLPHVTQLRQTFKQCSKIAKARAKKLRWKFVYFVERDVCQQQLSSSTY